MFDKYNSQAMLFGAICRVNNQYQTIGDKYYNGISLKQEYLLSVMEYYFCDNAPTLNELAQHIGSSHQNIKQIVSKLVDKGYLKLEQDKDDKRKRRVYFTEKYNQEKDEFEGRRNSLISKTFANISEDEITKALYVINKMSDNQKKLLIN
ncbi:MAG: MarR family winged helix-turn-helix transcriptional regulator [Acutalibacteraceae bacterium]|nr:MarR family winged helix-turn-helix transcriptional regulator [Acutalibacteraceae bacterium]